MARLTITLGALIFSFMVLAAPLQAQETAHPLDPLSWQEYWTVLEVLRDAKHLDRDTRFSLVSLREPPKALVWAWSPGEPIPRSAFAVVRQEKKSYEAVVDVARRRVISWTQMEEDEPSWTGEEFTALNDQVMKHPDFLAAMERRGITDLAFIDCAALPPGYFGTPEEQDRRIGHVHCEDVRDVRNTWARSIAGLTILVDMVEKKVIRVIDEGSGAMPDVSADYDPTSIGAPRDVPGPIRIEQPHGRGFKIRGHVVEWQKWRFHLRSDQRMGTVISTVTYQDGDAERRILYQGYLSEIFVPYMDPSSDWYARNFLDAGEFIAGGLTKPLLPGIDCPGNAIYLDAVLSTDQGRPEDARRMICLFERDTGDPSWRHFEGDVEGRNKRDLVVRSAAVIGNYDYILDWVFQQNGSIKVRVGSTGIAEVKIVAEAGAAKKSDGAIDVRTPPAERADAFGHFVDPHIVAVNHDHYFNFRLDLDVDGTTNSFMVDRLVTRTLPPDHPRRSIWVVESMLAKNEDQAKLRINLDRPSLWRVINAVKTNEVGYPTGYQLMPGMNANTLLTPDDYPRRRAGFIDHHLWVTPYREEERFAAGDYPTLSEPGKGLPNWTSANRSIEKTDLVVWYTIGMHHLVRGEDWPVMPVLWRSFELRPFDFFDRNPALDLPRSP